MSANSSQRLVLHSNKRFQQNECLQYRRCHKGHQAYHQKLIFQQLIYIFGVYYNINQYCLNVTSNLSAYGDPKFNVLDTPGFNAFQKKIVHAAGIITALTECPVNRIIVTIRFGRIDEIVKQFCDVLKHIDTYNYLTTVAVTSWDLSDNSEREGLEKELGEIFQRKFNQTSIYSHPIKNLEMKFVRKQYRKLLIQKLNKQQQPQKWCFRNFQYCRWMRMMSQNKCYQKEIFFQWLGERFVNMNTQKKRALQPAEFLHLKINCIQLKSKKKMPPSTTHYILKEFKTQVDYIFEDYKINLHIINCYQKFNLYSLLKQALKKAEKWLGYTSNINIDVLAEVILQIKYELIILLEEFEINNKRIFFKLEFLHKVMIHERLKKIIEENLKNLISYIEKGENELNKLIGSEKIQCEFETIQLWKDQVEKSKEQYWLKIQEEIVKQKQKRKRL